MSYARETIAYYDQNASRFIADTVAVEFSDLQAKFAAMLPAGGRILDLGCGSGRDSLAFLKQGFRVDAVDGSPELCAAASKLTGLEVTCSLFADFKPTGTYDGIWACSSLLHVPACELPPILGTLSEALAPDGVFYLSFKYGEFQGMRNGRWFTDLTETSFTELVASVPQLSIGSFAITGDVRPDRQQERWLNVWCQRNS